MGTTAEGGVAEDRDMERDLRHSAPEGQPETLILLCQSLADRGNGLDLAEVSQWLQETDPAVQVEVIDELCDRPRAVSRAATARAARLVLGLCSSDYGELEMQVRARKAGLDPFSVERVNLGDYCALAYPRAQGTDKAKALLAAAVARARAFPGSKPEQVRTHLARGQQKVSRRALFTLPPIHYQPVASIEPERCASEAGCQLCLEVCPWDALTKIDGRVLLDKSRCRACGLCVVECPRMAIELPTDSLPQLEAKTWALLRSPALAPSEPRGMLFVCRGNTGAVEELGRKGIPYPLGWLPVHVPCVGMVPISWLLGCLAWGAEAVGVLACDGTCSFGQQERIEEKVAYCRELLSVLGGSPDDVRLLRPLPETALAESLNRPLDRGVERHRREEKGPSLTGPQAAARAIQVLAEDYGACSALSLTHPSSPLGLVRIDGNKCTACGSCARACPTGALAFHEEDGTVSLDFDPTYCTACQQCSGWCPEASEQAVRIDKVADLQALSQGRVTLHGDKDVRCERCGAVIGPAAMLRRVETLLTRQGDTNAATIAAIARHCPSCRVARVSGSGLFSHS